MAGLGMQFIRFGQDEPSLYASPSAPMPPRQQDPRLLPGHSSLGPLGGGAGQPRYGQTEHRAHYDPGTAAEYAQERYPAQASHREELAAQEVPSYRPEPVPYQEPPPPVPVYDGRPYVYAQTASKSCSSCFLCKNGQWILAAIGAAFVLLLLFVWCQGNRMQRDVLSAVLASQATYRAPSRQIAI